MSSFYGNGGSNLPSVDNTDVGKVLTVNSQGKWDAETGTWIKNFVDGSESGSVRGIHSATENNNYSIGVDAVAEGNGTKASGDYSHAEGQNTVASALTAHAEGYVTKATANYTHAEGGNTTASVQFAHAEGYNTTASHSCSHAEGSDTVASGKMSHAEGKGTVANHMCQHVFGYYNLEDESLADSAYLGNYVEIVGNGTASDNRSNARTLDWQGNEYLAGSLTLGSTTLTQQNLIDLLSLLNNNNIFIINASWWVDPDTGDAETSVDKTVEAALLAVNNNKIIIFNFYDQENNIYIRANLHQYNNNFAVWVAKQEDIDEPKQWQIVADTNDGWLIESIG